jgi:pyruvate carboxylase subunit B
MRYVVAVGRRTLEVDLTPDGVLVDGRRVSAELGAVPDAPVRSLILDGASYRVVARGEGEGRWNMKLRGWHLTAEVADQRTVAIREIAGSGESGSGPRPLRAPMPGLVVRVEVSEGDDVRAGQGLVIVEAMKMENELRADTAARVRAVHVRVGQTVEKDQVLIELGPAPEI